jgi:hypothetical protein
MNSTQLVFFLSGIGLMVIAALIQALVKKEIGRVYELGVLMAGLVCVTVFAFLKQQFLIGLPLAAGCIIQFYILRDRIRALKSCAGPIQVS